MANAVYPEFKAACESGGANVNLLTGVVKAVMLDMASYTYSSAHQFLSDVPSGARVSISGALTSKAVTAAGAFTSANTRFDAVTGPTVAAIALFIDTGSPTTSPLVCFKDTGITGLPITTPSGASYNLIADPAGWFVL